MAEESTQERTEEATPRRKEKAREEGQTARSKELATSAVLLSGAISLLVFGKFIVEQLATIMRSAFSLSRTSIFDVSQMFLHLKDAIFTAFIMLVPFFAVVVFFAFLGPILLGGWLFSGKAITPKLNRLDPIAGLKRMFSMKALVELIKSIAKVVVVVFVAVILLSIMQDTIFGLSEQSIMSGLHDSLLLSAIAAIVISASTILIAIADVPFQIYDHAKKLRMSRQDVKDEVKDTEGKPEVKSKIRQLQQEMAQRRMMAQVPEADVVITNPTHFSVALKYDPNNMSTPVLVAKGTDFLALKIREIARTHRIEFVEAPLLCRSIYYTTELDDVIPEGLYLAVAQVLAYVFQMREFRKGRSDRPDYPNRLSIPQEYKKY